MANKPIIDIDINDQQFKEFYELFQQFQGKVGELPEDWKKVNEAASSGHEALAGAAGVIVESMVAASDHAKELIKHLKEATEAQKQFHVNTGQGESGLKKMKHEAKELADTLFGIGKFILKMGALGIGASVAGLFGFDKLAQHAVTNQRSARGLGLTTGQFRAFQTDMGRYVDEGTLENVANARNDLTQRVWLQRATGLSSDQIDRANAGELASQLALKMHDWWASTPESQHNTAQLQATGFTQLGFSLDDLRRLGAADRTELVRAAGQYGKDSRELNISNRDTDALYSFQRQLTLAGQKLETAFTSRLAALGPSLGSLMTTLEKDAEILINDVFSPENVKALENGIDTLTHFLGSQEFRDDVKIFIDGIAQLGKAILSFLKMVLPDAEAAPGPTDAPTTPATETMASHQTRGLGDPQANGGDTWIGRYFLNRNDYYGGTGQANAIYGGPYYNDINPKTQKGKDNLAYLGGLEHTLGLPPGVLAADVFAESSGIATAVSRKGAMGAMQLMPDTAKALGVNDPFDFAENTRGGATNLARLYKYYKGDLQKALAASNWGEGNLDKDINGYRDTKGNWHPGHGDDWLANAPNETQNHVKRVLDAMMKAQGKPVDVNVVVTNKAGANVAVSANAGSL